jgi:tryptophan synthase alpha chain
VPISAQQRSSSMNRLDQAFVRLRAANELGLFPYLMTGFPDRDTFADLLERIAEAGADGVELGVPFSDPLADGVTLQRVGALALEQGASIRMALDLLSDFRTRWQTPAVLMSYYNLVLAYGLQELARDGAEAGLDGLIVPDLPLEEAQPVHATCQAYGLCLVCMLAPTSTPARMAQTASLAGGFIYCVALLGVTGARDELSEELPSFLARVRQHCPQPLVVGFGISRPEHVKAMRGEADGVIVASSLADLIETTAPDRRAAATLAYVGELKAATRVDSLAVSSVGPSPLQEAEGPR